MATPNEPNPNNPPAEPPVSPPATPKPGPDPKPTEPPEPMIPKSRLDQEIQKRKETEDALKALQDADDQRKKAAMTEDERRKAEAKEKDDRLNAQDQQIKALALKDLQRTAADAAGLPPSWAERLKGDTAEALKADAEKLKAELPKDAQKPVLQPVVPSNGAPPNQQTEGEFRREVFGGGGDVFDGQSNRQSGGGVIIPDPNSAKGASG